ncbi:TlpA family protein disulfide reductase [Pedobacter rhodius]|uniref:TlpA disulfide reductase family protein n=1 Tax=Pedobacter rhodius TaxID=3004098 RepID=A0ABT4KV43_9SPHI|nr:TlpA disulfide reductase family protein [Pedobacter sp. SJ11]MCZ4222783.1 TlpA disulfide reductase family protein [Pedobacter sp. SJ11]
MLKKTLLIFLITFSIYVNAQTTTQQRTQPTLDENTIVRGEDGMVYPYKLWKAYLQTGKYSLKSRNTKMEDGRPEFVIFELTEAQRNTMMEKMPKPRPSEAFKEGEHFNGFKTSDINGNKFDLKNTTGKVVVLNFWFINCPPCKSEIPDLNELVNRYRDNKDVIFLAIALDDRYEIKDFLKTIPFNYNIVDNGRFLSDKFNVKSYPTHVVIDKTGTIKFSTVGLAVNTIAWVKKSIDESLAAN